MKVVAGHEALIAVSDQLTSELTPPPTDRLDACAYCHTWKADPTDRWCENCREVFETLEVDPLALSLVSMYKKPSSLRDWLTRYKGREDESEPYVPDYVPIVRALAGRYFIEHGAAISALHERIDLVTVVPSTDRQPPHPLEGVLGSLQLDTPVRRVLRRGTGPLAFRQPSKTAYAVDDTLPPGQTVVLIDDVYTTGARINSAAYALRNAGHQVAVAVVLARRINPDYNPIAGALWARQNEQEFSWSTSPITSPERQ